MRSDDSRADNLFSRLISYTPRVCEGGESRTALEDFCTEGLAWCLRLSREFKREFLGLVRSKLSKKQLLFPSDADGMTAGVETQFGFSRDEAKGRFDLKISDPSDGFSLVVEVKVESDLGDEQIDNYLKQLRGEREFLISLTKWPIRRKLEGKLDAALRWGDVQNLLEQTGLQCNFMLKQFAEFLKEQGMFPMKINCVSPELLYNWKDGFALQRDLWIILDKLSKEPDIKPFLKEKSTKIIFEPSGDRKKLWLGIYGYGKPLDWFGFEILEFGTSPKLLMIVSLKFDGIVPENKLPGQLGPTLKRMIEKFGCHRASDKFGCDYDPVQEQNQTWFNFRQPIEVGDEYNGNADKICGWLFSAIRELSK